MEVTWIIRSNISLKLLTAPLSILSLGAPQTITKNGGSDRQQAL
jgi:hypothetical protein